MQVRRPIVAGQFYPGGRESCLAEVEECLAARVLPTSLPQEIVAGIVPHAGWTFSGSLAGLVFAAIKRQHEKVDTFVIFGAAHSYFGHIPAVWDRGSWETPLGQVAVDERLAEEVISEEVVVSDPSAHRTEHSIEVQVPFIQHLFPDAKILPIVVPADERAIELGQAVGQIIQRSKGVKIVCIGSTDLTHYGPRYGFAPVGIGAKAIHWADTVNDQRFIEPTLKMDTQGLLSSAAENYNACGPGASAATVAAAKSLGKIQGLLLAHTNSNEVMQRETGTTSEDSVGYAAIVF